MIFMHNESGELLELLVRSMQEHDEYCKYTNVRVFRIGEIQLHSDSFDYSGEMKMSDFYKHFTFIGFMFVDRY